MYNNDIDVPKDDVDDDVPKDDMRRKTVLDCIPTPLEQQLLKTLNYKLAAIEIVSLRMQEEDTTIADVRDCFDRFWKILHSTKCKNTYPKVHQSLNACLLKTDLQKFMAETIC